MLARIGFGKGPPVPVKITALLQTGGGAAFVRGHQTDNSLNGIPVNFTPEPPNNLDLIQYITANGDFENKSLSQILDGLGAAQGDIIYRNATGWVVLTPGADGYVLTTHDAAANPTWEPASSGSGGGMLPLVTGDLPGPTPIADGRGQFIGVAL